MKRRPVGALFCTTANHPRVRGVESVKTMSRYGKKRRVERIRVGLPLRGRVSGAEVVLLDLSFMGCRIEHAAPLRVGSKARLSISWSGRSIDFDCHVIRCSLDTRAARHDSTTHYHSGLLFEKGVGESSSVLREIIVRQVIEALDEQKANAHGEIPKWLRPDYHWTPDADAEHAPFTSLPYLRIARERGYVSYVMGDGGWMKKRTRSAEQPEEGFTVWAYEDEDELERLTRVYEAANAETRALIRLCAELSLKIDDTLPPQRFEP